MGEDDIAKVCRVVGWLPRDDARAVMGAVNRAEESAIALKDGLDDAVAQLMDTDCIEKVNVGTQTYDNRCTSSAHGSSTFDVEEGEMLMSE